MVVVVFPLVPFRNFGVIEIAFRGGTPLINTVGHFGLFVASRHRFLVQETLVVPEDLPPDMSNSANAQTGCLAKNNKPKSQPSTGKMPFIFLRSLFCALLWQIYGELDLPSAWLVLRSGPSYIWSILNFFGLPWTCNALPTLTPLLRT